MSCLPIFVTRFWWTTTVVCVVMADKGPPEWTCGRKAGRGKLDRLQGCHSISLWHTTDDLIVQVALVGHTFFSFRFSFRLKNTQVPDDVHAAPWCACRDGVLSQSSYRLIKQMKFRVPRAFSMEMCFVQMRHCWPDTNTLSPQRTIKSFAFQTLT